MLRINLPEQQKKAILLSVRIIETICWPKSNSQMFSIWKLLFFAQQIACFCTRCYYSPMTSSKSFICKVSAFITGSELACRLTAAGFWPAAACLFAPVSGATEVLVRSVGAFSNIKENINRNNLGYDGDFKLSMAYMTVKLQIQNSIQMMTLLKHQRGKNPFCLQG